jgi:hypothetical protein
MSKKNGGKLWVSSQRNKKFTKAYFKIYFGAKKYLQ